MMTANWPIVKLVKVISHRKEFVTIDDLSSYKRPRVQLHAKGIILRDEILGAQIKTKKQQVCKTDDLLVAEIDAKVGGFGIVPAKLDGAIVSSHYFLFTIDSTQMDTRFLDYYIRTPYFRDQVQAQGSTNYAAIRPGHVLEYEIPLPPLKEQRRIVARIDELVRDVEEAQSLRQQAMEEAGALLASARNGVILDTASDIVSFDDIFISIIDCLHSNPRYSETGIPCIRSADVGYGNLLLETARKTDEDEYNRRTVRGEPRPGDIIFVREGGGTGKCGLAQQGQKFSLGQRVMMMRPDPDQVIPEFVLHQILSPLIQADQILPFCKGSASPHLNISSLKKFQFRMPPISIQKRIVAHLNGIERQVFSIQITQNKIDNMLKALIPSILDHAFRGEL